MQPQDLRLRHHQRRQRVLQSLDDAVQRDAFDDEQIAGRATTPLWEARR
jgi:hypothetical protein